MISIHKYLFMIGDAVDVEMPSNATLIDCQVQHGIVCLWAIVDTACPTARTRWFRVIGTGHPIPDIDQLTYFRTVQLNGGDLVFHVFEVSK